MVWAKEKPGDPNLSMYLPGPLNDALRWKETFLACGYVERQIRILWDKEGTAPEDLPTYDNIVSFQPLDVRMPPWTDCYQDT